MRMGKWYDSKDISYIVFYFMLYGIRSGFAESETFESEESIFKKILRNGCVLEAYIYMFIYIYINIWNKNIKFYII